MRNPSRLLTVFALPGKGKRRKHCLLIYGEGQGRRLNSPNDAVYGVDGSLYFTDPPYGLEGLEESPLRELDFNGIYRLARRQWLWFRSTGSPLNPIAVF